MKKILQTFRYLSKTIWVMIMIEFVVIVSTLAASDVIYFLTDAAYNKAPHPVVTLSPPLEVTAGIFALLIGLALFIATFKVALANGISRKTFLLANLPVAGIASAAFSIFNLIVVMIHGLFWPTVMMIGWNNPQIGWAGLLVLQFALYFLLITIGWFISLAYYRSTTLVKWAISVAPVVLYGLLRVAQASTGYPIFATFSEYTYWSMGIDKAPLTLLVYAAILCGLVYLLLRRAPLKD